jgi:hypothetical protein
VSALDEPVTVPQIFGFTVRPSDVLAALTDEQRTELVGRIGVLVVAHQIPGSAKDHIAFAHDVVRALTDKEAHGA